MQECERFNKLLSVIKSSLVNLKKAIKGEMVMSVDLDGMYQSLLMNKVPQNWEKKAYPSMKKLASWYDDLLARVDFFRNWVENEKPKSFWLSSFFFPQGFLTSVLQNFARKQKLPIGNYFIILIINLSYFFSL